MLTALTLSKEQEERLLNPAPGTKAAYAYACGIDLRQTIANLRLTPQQRLEKLAAMRELAEQMRVVIHKRQLARGEQR